MLAGHLAFRYLRRRRASWLALAAVTLTVMVPVTVLGIMQGWIEVTHAQIRAAETDLTVKSRTGRGTVYMQSGLDQHLSQIANVEEVAPYIETTAALAPRYSSTQIIGVKIDGFDWQADHSLGRLRIDTLHKPPVIDLRDEDVEADRRGSGFLTPTARAHMALAAQEWLAPLAGMPLPPPPKLKPFKPGLIVGRELAMLNPMHLGLGAPVRLVIPDGTGGTVGRIQVEVSDTIGTGVYEIDRYTTQLALPVAQYLTMMDGRHPASDGLEEVTGYRVTLKDPSQWQETQAAIEESPLLYAAHWTQLRSGMVGSLHAYERLIVVVMCAIQLLCIFIVYAVFSTLVAEKRHDIGVLKGIGATRSAIVGTFQLAGIIVCALGGLLGWALGWLALALLIPTLEAFGIYLFPQEVIYTAQTPISYDAFYPLLFLALMTFIGFIAASVPALRAGRIEPIDTIREVG